MGEHVFDFQGPTKVSVVLLGEMNPTLIEKGLYGWREGCHVGGGFVFQELLAGIGIGKVIFEGSIGMFRELKDCWSKIFIRGKHNEVIGILETLENASLESG
jgi:hypothetical protein